VASRVLYLVHGLPPEEYSGTPLIAHGYATVLARRGWEVAVLYAAGSGPSWHEQAGRLARGLEHAGLESAGDPYLRLAVPRTPWVAPTWCLEAPSHRLPKRSPESVVFTRLLERFRPDLLHVVDNVNLPLDFPELASAAGVPVVRTVSCTEDLCALIAPVSARSGPAGYCDGAITPERCAACAAAEIGRFDLPPSVTGASGAGERDGSVGPALHTYLLGLLERKRTRALAQFTEVFDRVVFSTAAFRDYFCQSLALDPARVRVIGMGMDRGPWTDSRSRRNKGPQHPVVFGLAGVFDRAKGQDAVVEAFSSPPLADRQDWRLRFFGGGDPQVVAALLGTTAAEGSSRVEWSGAYAPGELPDLLSQVDVGLSVSRFETFHRVTREYLFAGLPVVTSPTFGAADIVRDGVNGLVYDPTRPGALAAACNALLDDRPRIERLAEGAAATQIRPVDEEVDELSALYEEVLTEHRPPVWSRGGIRDLLRAVWR
jgi:glycosyltransferase involved in cell wall biosynthesis